MTLALTILACVAAFGAVWLALWGIGGVLAWFADDDEGDGWHG